MNKKLTTLLLTLLVSGGLWADMDKYCSVSMADDEDWRFAVFKRQSFIMSQCERNNIFIVNDAEEIVLHEFIRGYCRFDRAINRIQQENNMWLLSCVLYSNEIRKSVRAKE